MENTLLLYNNFAAETECLSVTCFVTLLHLKNLKKSVQSAYDMALYSSTTATSFS